MGRAHCYWAPEEWDSWKSPRPTAPQTEPCWLSCEATWRHGERPADSWGTGRCPGNRESSRVSLGQAERHTTKLLWVRVSASMKVIEKFKKAVVKNEMCIQRRKKKKKKLKKEMLLKGQTTKWWMNNTNIQLAGCNRVYICAKFAKSTDIRIKLSLLSVSWDWWHVI